MKGIEKEINKPIEKDEMNRVKLRVTDEVTVKNYRNLKQSEYFTRFAFYLVTDEAPINRKKIFKKIRKNRIHICNQVEMRKKKTAKEMKVTVQNSSVTSVTSLAYGGII